MVPSPEPRAVCCAVEIPLPATSDPELPDEVSLGDIASSGPAPVVLDVELTATVDHAALLRRRFLAWLVPLTGDLDVVEDLVLAVYEALANAVDHAYPAAVGPGMAPGVVSLYAELVDTCPHGRHQPGQHRHLNIQVGDHGTWQPRGDELGWRGRGLELMRGLTDTLRLERASTGTTVHLHRHLPAPARSTT